jgi:hypothetical protein
MSTVFDPDHAQVTGSEDTGNMFSEQAEAAMQLNPIVVAREFGAHLFLADAFESSLGASLTEQP